MARTKRTWDVSLTIVDTLPKDALLGGKLLTAKQLEADIRYMLLKGQRTRVVKNIMARDRDFDRKHGRDGD